MFKHLSPYILFWCLRWGAGHGPSAAKFKKNMFMVCDSPEDYVLADECMNSLHSMLWCHACSAPPSAFVFPPAVLYVCLRGISYFLVMFVWCRDWREHTQRETLYSYFVQIQPDLHAFLESKLRGLFGPNLAGPAGYTLLHLVVTILVGATSCVPFLLHNLVGVVIILQGIHKWKHLHVSRICLLLCQRRA